MNLFSRKLWCFSLFCCSYDVLEAIRLYSYTSLSSLSTDALKRSPILEPLSTSTTWYEFVAVGPASNQSPSGFFNNEPSFFALISMHRRTNLWMTESISYYLNQLANLGPLSTGLSKYSTCCTCVTIMSPAWPIKVWRLFAPPKIKISLATL